MSDRRAFLRGLSSAPLAGGLLSASAEAAVSGGPARDYFKELGVRPFINAAGTYTMMTASLMPPEVMQAMQAASRKFVNLVALNEAVGRRLSALIGCEAAMVTAGAASALTLGTAACMTGKDTAKIQRLPDSTGMKNEVIIQKSHRYGYDHAVRNCGVRMVEVETAAELEAAVNPNTLMMLFFNANEPAGKISGQQFVELGKKHGVPTFNDAAADVPPVENFSKYTRMGFDLVTFSGGKGIRGPQSSGLLLGRKDLIEAALLNAPPNSDSIGRGQKVNKEEMIGLMVAVEMFFKKDHAAEWKEWERRAEVVRKAVGGLKGVRTEIWIPEIANHVPHVRVLWEPGAVTASIDDIRRKMREGDPAIELVPGGDALTVGVWMLEPGEAEIVARRLREVLKGALAA
ncbi:MAG: selenocysteine synthase [Acidobacteria bacterium]|nr:selenocysteine synthase [Acidobacteriota bacterium]